MSNENINPTDACCPPTRSEDPAFAARGDIRALVQKSYGQAVESVVSGARGTCCDAKATTVPGVDPITRDLYGADNQSQVPADAVLASFGCGNPTALADLTAGEVVLDLGSGGGIDVLLSARRVAPHGKAYGLDMTPQMLELARKNQRQAGVVNAEFLEGHIEAVPLPKNTINVVISNCVINLSADKDQVLREAFRVLKPGGRLAVSDIVLTRDLTPQLRRSIELWAGCIAGALVEDEYRKKLTAAGFVDISITATRVYTRADAKEIADGVTCCDQEGDAMLSAIDGAAISAFIRARKADPSVQEKSMQVESR